MSDFQNKGKFLGAKITPYNVMRNIGMNWESDGIVPEHILNEGVPYQGELLLQAGGFSYDTDTHTIESRITPKFNATLKQGLVAKGDGTTAKADYGVMNLCESGSGYTQNLTIRFIEKYTATSAPLCGEYRALPGLRGWAIPSGYSRKTGTTFFIGASDGNAASVVSLAYTNTVSDWDLIELRIREVEGELVFTAFRNGVANGTVTLATQDRIYCNGAEFLFMNYNQTTAHSPNTLPYLEILRDNVTVFRTHCNGSLIDEVTGTIPTVAGITFTQDNNSSFRNDEYGFAVQTAKIYPRNLANTGYAGLVGEPDLTFQGLIALKGKPEIGMNAYLGTLYDFGNSASIVGAGIDWSGWDNADCNLDLVGTAETNLDLGYLNAITSSLMSCESMIYGGTSNIAQRMFFKVTDLVMKADGSFLAGSGTVTDILVYKRDLCLRERINVLKWCNALPFQSVELVKDGDDFVVIDDNFTYVCL